MSFLSCITNRDATPLLERMTSFTEARHRVLAENVANIDTPGYRAQQVDVRAFQQELQRAAEARESPSAPLRIHDSREFQVRADGGVELTPTREPAENVLFHDGTNESVERQMAGLAENGLMHQLSTELLRSNYGTLMSAIRGRVQ